MKVICVHCESSLTLQDDLLGKQIRCPICREIFVAAAAPALAAIADSPVEDTAPADEKPATSRTDAPLPTYRSGPVTDFVQVLPAEPDPSPAQEVTGEPKPRASTRELAWSPDVELPEFPGAAGERNGTPSSANNRADAADVTRPGPIEVTWSEGPAPLPSGPPDDAGDPKPEHADEHREELGAIRPRRKRGRLVVLVLLMLVVFGGLGAGGYFLKNYMDAAPERLYAQAKTEYEAKNYEPARKLYEQFAQEHANDPRAAEARFFAELSALRLAVFSVTVRSDPIPAERHLEKFLLVVEDPALRPFIEPNRFGLDIWETALKLTEEVTGKAVELFSRDKPEDAVPWLDRGVRLGKVVDRFRPSDLQRENVYQQMAELHRKIDDARARLAFLAEIRRTLAEPDDTLIVAARKEADDRGQGSDPSFIQIIDNAERVIADRVVYKRLEPPVAPIPQPAASMSGLLFAPRIDGPIGAGPPSTGPATVFFTLVRGIVYALDENDGHVLWAARVGIDCDTLPLIVPGSELYPELAVIIANDGTKASLTACLARTGETYWCQELPTACIGQPVLVGQRLFVSLRDKPVPAGARPRRDEIGVILEIELASGLQIGRIALGRTLGAPAVRRPGTGQIYFTAESRGVYVFDVEKIGPDGARLDPVYLGLLPTGHAAGSMHGDPMIAPGDNDSTGYLILGIADSLESMKLRTFPLGPVDKAPAIAGELPPPITLNGWLSFPPYADTEKIAAVTDRGEFGLFGINQTGNLDPPIFVLPPQTFAFAEAARPSRGQVVYADESVFWLLARGALHQLRLGFDFDKGLKLVATGKPMWLGEPLHAAQVNARRDTAVVVTQTMADGTCRATAIDLRTGRLRWQRQIGLVAQAGPIRLGDAIVLMDRAGGLYAIETRPLAGAVSAEWLIDERWLVDRPMANVITGHLLPVDAGRGVDAMITVQREQGQFAVYRHYEPGKAIASKTIAIPAPLAGNPIIVGRTAFLPLANGLLYRWLLDQDKQLEAGPSWRGERVSTQALCHLAAISENELIAGDGAKSLHRWRWPAGQDEFGRVATLSLTDRLAAPPLVVSRQDRTCLIVADIKSNLIIWDADKLAPGAQPLQGWRPSEKGPVTPGALTAGPFRDHDDSISYVINDRLLVRLVADAQTMWRLQEVIRCDGMIAGRPARLGDRMFVTERDGRCRAFDARTGQSIASPIRFAGPAAPVSAAAPLNEAKLLAPLSDGTLLLVPTGIARAESAPVSFYPLPPFGLPIPVLVPNDRRD